MVDNYGPRYAIGGGAFSGKDSTKVDRSAAYAARQIAVDILKQYPEVHEASVELAYAIGVREPLEITIRARNKENEEVEIDHSEQDLSPLGIIKRLDLRKPQFQKTAEWGHFGSGFGWD